MRTTEGMPVICTGHKNTYCIHSSLSHLAHHLKRPLFNQFSFATSQNLFHTHTHTHLRREKTCAVAHDANDGDDDGELFSPSQYLPLPSSLLSSPDKVSGQQAKDKTTKENDRETSASANTRKGSLTHTLQEKSKQ